MSKLEEIEEAIENLPAVEQEELLAFLTRRLRNTAAVTLAKEDPFAAMIGAFAGPCEATGRKAEDLLYGAGD
jgi:hypothetical protein